MPALGVDTNQSENHLGRCQHPVSTLGVNTYLKENAEWPTLYFPALHLYFYYLFVFPSALSKIIILPSKTGPRQDKCLDKTATQSSQLFFGRCQETSRTICTIQVGYAKARWCCFPRCFPRCHHILWQQPKTGRPPTDTLCVLVTSASPLHLKKNWNDSSKCVCVVQNMKKENTIFSHHKEKKRRQGERLRTSACAGQGGLPALRITLLCFSSSVKCKQANLCQKLPFPETAVPASG